MEDLTSLHPKKSRRPPDAARTRPTSSTATNSSRLRHSRRHQSDGTAGSGSPTGDPVDGSRRGRRQPKKEASRGPEGSASPQDSPGISRQSHRRRSKGSSESGGPVRKSRLKDSSPAPDTGGAREGSGTPHSLLKPAPEKPGGGGL